MSIKMGPIASVIGTLSVHKCGFMDADSEAQLNDD